MLDVREITRSRDMVPPSSKGNKDPSTKKIYKIKKKYSELPLRTSAIKKQESEIEMTRGPIVDKVDKEVLSVGGIF